jgi:hypothetical protein
MLSRHCERSEAIHATTERKNGLLRRGVYHRAGRRPDPLAPRNDEEVRNDGGFTPPSPVPGEPRIIMLYLLFEHDLRANASRLSRGKTGTHPSGRGPRACFSGSCSRACSGSTPDCPELASAYGSIEFQGNEIEPGEPNGVGKTD